MMRVLHTSPCCLDRGALLSVSLEVSFDLHCVLLHRARPLRVQSSAHQIFSNLEARHC